MKIIKLANGEIRFGYEFEELTPELQLKAINDHIEFEIDVMDEKSQFYDLAVEMDKMQTPWFLGQEIYDSHKEDIIETIKLNYLFDDEGEILPLTTHTNGNTIVKYTFGKHEILCTVEDKL